jgi:competence ComEA-like helix-hairpin-helix protein
MQLPKYLYYSRRERQAFAVLSLLICICFLLPLTWAYFFPHKDNDFSEIAKQIAVFEAHLAVRDSTQKAYYQSFKKNYNKNNRRKFSPHNYSKYGLKNYAPYEKKDAANGILADGILQLFDPNTADSAALSALGLRPHVVRAISNYRQKGGKFRCKNDLKKIYALDSTTFETLIPFIALPDTVAAFSRDSLAVRRPFAPNKTEAIIDINTATSADLQQLHGIGAGLAGRIIKYRHELGGFVNVQQIAEIYKFPDSTFQRILPQLQASAASSRIERLNLNTATVEQLSRHPYLSPYQARAIVRFRDEQKNAQFSRVEVVLSIPELDDYKKTARRILPYLML